MPCNTVQVNTVSLPKIAPELLDAALADLLSSKTIMRYYVVQAGDIKIEMAGYSLTLSRGQLRSTSLSEEQLGQLSDQIKNAVSRQAVFMKARQHGWKVRQVGPRQYEVQR